MAQKIDLSAVSDAMIALEDQTKDAREDVPVGEVAAKVLGVEHSEGFDQALTRESRRVLQLIRNHYIQYGVKLTPDGVAALAFVQGITFAAAVEEVKRGS